MSDDELTEFWIRKDKHKNKNKGKKSVTPEEMAKKIETSEKKTEKTTNSNARVEQTQKIQTVNEEPSKTSDSAANGPQITETAVLPEPPGEQKVEEEEQWNEFEEKAVELSNLKITRLNMEEEEERAAAAEAEESRDINGEEKKDGVWKIEEQKSIQSTICEAVDAGLDDGLQEVKATVAAMNASARWSSQSKEMQPSPLPRGVYQPGMRRKKAAPDINNDMAFPSLADAQASGNRKKREEHEGGGSDHRGGAGGRQQLGGTIRGLGSSRDSGGGGGGAYKPPMLRTANRFNALTDHGSLMRNS